MATAEQQRRYRTRFQAKHAERDRRLAELEREVSELRARLAANGREKSAAVGEKPHPQRGEGTR